MNLDTLRGLVQEQYAKKYPLREAWADWLYEHHVLWVADKTAEYCDRLGADKDIAVAAALLHDIADSVTARSDPTHEETSLEIARDLCAQAGYNSKQITVIVDDICVKHGCRDGVVPESEEGKIMAAADAAAHYMTDFFFHALSAGSANGDYAWQLNWMRKKIKRDFTEKIFHEEIRKQLEPYYRAWLLVTSMGHVG